MFHVTYVAHGRAGKTVCYTEEEAAEVAKQCHRQHFENVSVDELDRGPLYGLHRE